MEAIYVKNNLNQFSKPQKKLSKTLLSVGSTAALSVFGISLLIFKKAFGRGEPTKEQFPKDPRIHRSRLWLKHTRHEHVYTTSTDGLKLHGVIYNPYHRSDPPTNPVIMLCIHGYHSDGAGDFAPIVPFYYAQNRIVCLPDQRAHGQSEGKYIGFGYHDHFDCIRWCEEMVCRFGPDCKIYLHGVSMGSATVLSCCDDPKLPCQVKGIIADCGYSDGWEQLSHVLKKEFHLPAFPLLYTYNIVCKLMGKFDIKKTSPIKNVAKSKVPILFIHGDQDDFVPTKMVYKLYKACTAPKKLVIVHKAGHAQSYIKNSCLYEKAIMNFFRE